MTDRLDVVAAFVDGESVAAGDLFAALGHEDAREYLVDVLALRGLVTDARPQVVTASSAAARRFWSPLRLVAAAALIVVGVAGGFAMGRRTADVSIVRSDVIRDAAVTPAPAKAPAPTHVFRMENGINWNERAGGN